MFEKLERSVREEKLMAKNKLEFQWRVGDFGIRATPKRLVRFDENEDNETIDFVRFCRDGEREYCYSIGYFKWDEDDESFDLRLVGDRFRIITDEEMWALVGEALAAAYDTLMLWKKSEGYDD